MIAYTIGTQLVYYGMDASGERLWLISNIKDTTFGPGDVTVFTLFRAKSGTFDSPTPSEESLEEWGKLTVTGDKCKRMTMKFETPDGTKTWDARQLVAVIGTECGI